MAEVRVIDSFPKWEWNGERWVQMAEFRFYINHTYTCPRCEQDLIWLKRKDLKDSMILLHERTTMNCPLSDKLFYPPATFLVEADRDSVQL